MDAMVKNLLPVRQQRHSQLLIDHATGIGFGSDDFGVAGATPLSATASKNRSMTAFPRLRFASEICSFGKCAWPYEHSANKTQLRGREQPARTELWPMGRCSAGHPKAFSRNGTHGIDYIDDG